MFHPWKRQRVQTVAGCTKGSTATGKRLEVEVAGDSIEAAGHCEAHHALGMEARQTGSHMASRVVVHLGKKERGAWAKNTVREHAALRPAVVCSNSP